MAAACERTHNSGRRASKKSLTDNSYKEEETMALSQTNNEKLQELLDSMNATVQRTERTTDIVSAFAYLIGVRKSIFENPHEPPVLEIFEKLEKEKAARIIRNLCIIRTAIEHNFGKINNALRNELKHIGSLPEYIPNESLMQLSNDGITVFKKNSTYLGQHIIEINRLIGDRINNCQAFFPTWLEWKYLRQLFIMPEGLTEEGIKAGANEFFSHLENYPYGVYMNWAPYDCGNILYSDKKFVSLLYEWNNDQFTQFNRVEDASDYVTGNIYDFIEEGQKVIFVVDCENSDPYNLCAALMSLDEESCSKIQRIVLFDDIHTSSAWRVLEDHVSIPVEHILIERLKESKSLVDMRLAMRISEEHFKNQVDSFVLVSSDSDYWSVITSLPEAKFLFMIEHGKIGIDLREALEEKGIFYCYIDEFHSAKSEKIMLDAIQRELRNYMAEHLQFNFRDMLDSAITATRVPMSEGEKKQFFDKHIRPFQAGMDTDGNLQITLKL